MPKFKNTMKKIRLFLLLPLVMLFVSCLGIKDVRYLQPNENLQLNSEGLIPYDNIPKYRVTRHDVLKLNIITTPKGDAAQFYSSLNAQQGVTGGAGGDFYFSGLNIDEEGYIYVMGMGKIKAEGRTIPEIAAEMQQKVNENFLPEKSEVRLFLEGIRYTFITDVDGKNFVKTVPRATLSITDAIAENGGLDKQIDRKNVIVYRRYPEGVKKAQIDLTREDVQNSPYFWVQNGDTYMFNTRPRSFYGFGKEPIQTLTTGISLVTTALSIYLLFSRF